MSIYQFPKNVGFCRLLRPTIQMEVPRFARKEYNHARLRLEGNMCPMCGEKFFPPRGICPNCQGSEVTKPEQELEVTNLATAALGLAPKK
jgi:uncharacterized OB-fold protein